MTTTQSRTPRTIRERKSSILALERTDASAKHLDLLCGLDEFLADVSPDGERRQIREEPQALDAIADALEDFAKACIVRKMDKQIESAN